jgi:hypothetical protein
VKDGETILWERLDTPGHEIAAIASDADGWVIEGVAVFSDSGQPCCLEYEIRCSGQWITRHCILHGSVGGKPVQTGIERNSGGEWSVDGTQVAGLRGCDDIDLGFSPVTNLLPIRRLALPVGESAIVKAAWVRFPQLTLEVLEQSYARTARDRYEYTSAGGAFRRELTVDAFGCVLEYPGIWRAETTARLGRS